MDIQGDMPITLVIKAPNQRMEDQTVDCMLGWTIRKLKYHLESVYPSKPKHHEQRLIYSGKLLQDHLTLKEILKQYDATNTHTVHLVCSNSSGAATLSSSHKNPQPTVAANPNIETSPNNSSSIDNGLTESASDGLRHRGHTHTQNVPVSSFQSFPGPQPFSPDTASPVPPPGCPYTPQQYAWLLQQQAYSQYMMQYMQYYQQSFYGGGQPLMVGGMMPPSMNPLNMSMPATFPVPTQQAQPVPQAQQQQQPQAGGEANNAQRGNNVRMNAQGGMDDDDEDEREPRDWLHHTYFILRFITFVGILVFYSSFSRFAVVMAGSLVIYFFQKMRIAREQNNRRERQQREEEAQQQQQEQQQQQQEENVETEQAQDGQQDRNTQEDNNSSPEDVGVMTNQEPQTEEVAAEERGNEITRSLYFVLKTIESFFSSLVPVPPELEAN